MKLQLYKKDTCPYCQKVMRYIRESGRTDVEMMDILLDERNRQRLIKVGGKQQVPCLFIDGRPMFESGDILTWLEEHSQE